MGVQAIVRIKKGMTKAEAIEKARQVLEEKSQAIAKDKRAKALGRAKDAIESSMLSRVLSSDTLAEKIEAIRSINPYFYLLTPLPRSDDDPTN
jgi:hypothetical protein